MIFGQDGDLAKKFAEDFDKWQTEPRTSALAHNLRFDDRVSQERVASFTEIWESVGRDLLKALTQYREHRVYTTRPEFTQWDKNHPNLSQPKIGPGWLPPTGV